MAPEPLSRIIYNALHHRGPLPKPWAPSYIWINDSDPDTDDEEAARSSTHEPLPLSRSAQETLAKLKERTPKHLLEVQYYWDNLEAIKLTGLPKDLDGDEVFRVVGILITMPDHYVDVINKQAAENKEKTNFRKWRASLRIG